MKIYFTLSKKQFENVNNSDKFQLYDCNFLNLALSKESCASKFKESVSEGNWTEPEYENVFVCSGEASDEDVIQCIWTAVDGIGSYPLWVVVDSQIEMVKR